MIATTRTFTYKHSPAYSHRDRWIAHDPDGNFAGEFRSESEAGEAVDRWNSSHGDLVRIKWTGATTDSDHDRGTYKVALDIPGSGWSRITSGWHGMEQAAQIAAGMRDFVAKYGPDVAGDAARAFSG